MAQSLSLYRRLRRRVRRLPAGTQAYYVEWMRQHFIAHRDEPEERAAMMRERALSDALWIEKKFAAVSDADVVRLGRSLREPADPEDKGRAASGGLARFPSTSHW